MRRAGFDTAAHPSSCLSKVMTEYFLPPVTRTGYFSQARTLASFELLLPVPPVTRQISRVEASVRVSW